MEVAWIPIGNLQRNLRHPSVVLSLYTRTRTTSESYEVCFQIGIRRRFGSVLTYKKQIGKRTVWFFVLTVQTAAPFEMTYRRRKARYSFFVTLLSGGYHSGLIGFVYRETLLHKGNWHLFENRMASHECRTIRREHGKAPLRVVETGTSPRLSAAQTASAAFDLL